LILNYILFAIDGCHTCYKARKYLEKEGIPFQEKNILEDQEAVNQLKEKVGEIVTPVLLAGNDILIGKDILSLNKGE
jgi:glutaredoxin